MYQKYSKSASMKFKKILIYCIGFALFLYPLVYLQADIFNVNTTTDTADNNPGDGVCDDGTGLCSLRAAIQESNALAGTDDINLPEGVYTITINGINEDVAASGDFDITSDINILGTDTRNTIIDADSLDRVFEVFTDANLSLHQLEIVGGFLYVAHGAGILNNGSISLSNVAIKNCLAKGDDGTQVGNGFGGGIYNNGTANLTACTLYNNSSHGGDGANGTDGGGGGGGGAGLGGGVYNTLNGNFYAINCTFSGNIALGGKGGNSTPNNGVWQTVGAPGGGDGGNAGISGGGVGGNGNYGGGGGGGGSDYSPNGNGGNGGFGGGGGGGGATSPGGNAAPGGDGGFGGGNGGTSCCSAGSGAGGGGGLGAAIFNDGGNVELYSTTIAFNQAIGGARGNNGFGGGGQPGSGIGGGIFNATGAGMVSINNTLIGQNIADTSEPAIYGDISSTIGYNIIDTLGTGNLLGNTEGTLFDIATAVLPLANNGGPTNTHALSCLSPAIDAGTESDILSTDQRGLPRILLATVDVGALEQDDPFPAVDVQPITASLCNGESININGNPSGGNPPYTHQWSGTLATGLNDNSIENPTLTVAGFPAATFDLTYTLTDAANCTTTQTVFIDIVATAEAGTANAPLSVCNDDDSLINLADLITEADGGGQWSSTSGYPISNSFDPTTGTINANGEAANTYAFTYTVGTGACADSVQVELDVVAAANTGTANNDLNICNNSDNTITLSDLLTDADEGGVWSVADESATPVSFDATLGQINPNGEIPDTYTFSYTLSTAPCTNTIDISLQITAAVSAGNAIVDTLFVCNNSMDNIDLNDLLSDSDGSGTWSVASGSATPISFDPTLAQLSPSDEIANNYTFSYTVDNGICSDSVSLAVSILPIPAASINLSSNIACIGDAITLNVVPHSNSATYSWNLGNGVMVTGNDIVHTWNTPTFTPITVSITDNDCGTIVSDSISINAVSFNAIPENFSFIEGESISLNATASSTTNGNVSISWNEQAINPYTVTPSTTSTYTVVATDAVGCNASAIITATLLERNKGVLLPNAFSPNNDGINDTFKIIGNDIAELSIEIYSRWGLSVFNSNSLQNNAWDGNYQGEAMPVGVYVYVVQLSYLNGKTETLKGNVSLLR